MKLRIQEVVKVTGGTLKGTSQVTEITGVEFDSRKVASGELFVPLEGNRDGHEFLTQAKESGAVATLCRPEFFDEKLAEDWLVLLVPNPLEAMQKLASYYRAKINPTVIAITGSNGKTTTKDMVASVLSTTYLTYKTQGNYNNDIGLPYTILHMPEQTQMLVLEMGMNHKDEITELSKMGLPDIAAITLVGESHIEYLGSRQGIAEAKMEIVDGLNPDGALIVPVDEPLLPPLYDGLPQRIETFGLDQREATISATLTKEAATSTEFKVQDVMYHIPVLGSYNVKNALIAIKVGELCQVPTPAIQQGLSQLILTQNRSEWVEAKNGAQLLSDVYNANPTAMSLVLDTFAKLTLPKGGRRIAVLADMGELGEHSQELHLQVGEHLLPENYDVIFLYGEWMKEVYNQLQEDFAEQALYHYSLTEKEELLEQLNQTIQSNDLVLLKGSNSMNLAEIVRKLSEKD
ncbi:UDP-N-acetylmuramoyl-tripeptide--D-alanyl-D-alanine ligase [Vagococcus humatus]|uniref:UDP-N-acetylmuramoyl-tripeptide--D-alanyl-D-alanine ligase n=1 Tax=Vagococcus humatus TaxID=1889241 RepID=A0A429Z5E7_9ENTE|nr:UDP-N-acetylmuramoyl-tripeptide--D-alanyl-D-alanine ligase [Vagococcus humatus]RST88917.1 UDP-N-acetylmuramoyl-tripeptide--D-alanyl-D-alanine ligase [Vagococcus humatus]